MSNSFTHAPSSHYGGIPIEEWLRRTWDSAVFRGENTIVAKGSDGMNQELPRHKCGVVFREFKPAYGTKGAYFATPIAIVDFRSGLRAAMSGNRSSHGVVKAKDVIVPLGDPEWTNSSTTTVLQQCARQWTSGGENTSNMSTDNVINMYYSALQSLVFTAGSATTAEDQQVWFCAIVAMTRAMSILYRAEPKFRAVTEAMVTTPGMNDMLQKSLAHILQPDAPWDQRTKLEILEVLARRSARHGTAVVGLSPGALIVYVLVPLLRDAAMDSDKPMTAETYELLLSRFNAAAGKLLEAFVTVVSTDTAAMRAKTLVALGSTASLEPSFTDETATKFVEFCDSTKDVSIPAPWVSYGMLEAPPVLEADVRTDRYNVDKHKNAACAARILVRDTTSFDVLSFKGIDWCGIQFHTIGTYTVTAHELGLAEAGHGNTQGKELVANWRLTVGNNVLPPERHGYSSAGMNHKRDGRGKWSYEKDRPLNMSLPFDVCVHEDHVLLQQGKITYATIARNYGSGVEPALLAFKNLRLSVKFVAAAVVVPVAPAAAVDTTALDLPATALLAQLRLMAETSAKSTS